MYHTFDSVFPRELEKNRTQLIYPATDRHIEKARATELELFRETPQLYENVTLNYINEQKTHLNWVTFSPLFP